jgi:hypothetical protein
VRRATTLAVALTAVALASPQKEERSVKVAGCVQEGVEGGCLMLVTEAGKKYNLIGEKRPAVGIYAEVTGTPRPGTPTICMEGEPLEIKEWRKLRDACTPEK